MFFIIIIQNLKKKKKKFSTGDEQTPTFSSKSWCYLKYFDLKAFHFIFLITVCFFYQEYCSLLFTNIHRSSGFTIYIY